MVFFTLLVGVVVGLLVGKRLSQHALFLYYHRYFYTKAKFLDVYDLVDDEFHYNMYSGTTDMPPKKYVDYLRLVQKMRPKAYKIYKDFRREIVRAYLTRLALTLFVPAVLLFWTTWYYYIAAYILTLLGFVAYVRYRKDYGIDYNAILIVSLVLNSKE